MDNEMLELIIDKLLSDGLLLKKANELNLKIGLKELSEEYIKSVLNIVCRKKEDYASSNFKDMETGIYGGIIYRRMTMETSGDIIKSHKHNYDHFTYVECGVVDINGEIYKSGQWAKVPKNVVHTIKALSSKCVTYCINSEYEVMESDK